MASFICRRLGRSSLVFRRYIVTVTKDRGINQYFTQMKGALNVDSKGAAAVGHSNPVVVPVESTSVAAGLFVNKIDYSMLVYPEFPELEEVTETETFATRVTKLLNDKLDTVEIDKECSIPDELLHGLKKLGIYGMRIPKDYGGLGLNDKQVTRIYEELGRDWSVMLTVYAHHDLVVQAVLRYGTEEQKKKYLPRLASGESIGAFCLHEECSGYDVAAMGTTSKPMQVANDLGGLRLNGTKSWITNGNEADILIVFAKYITAHVDENNEQLFPTTAFIVDRKLQTGIKTLERRQPIGIRGAKIYDLQFDNIEVNDSDVLGGYGHGFHVAMQVQESQRYVFAAAIAAFLRRLLVMIAAHCNATKRFGVTLSETVGIQARISDITRNTYILETLAYYIAGVRDDDDVGHKHFQLESSMATLFARKSLNQAIVDAIEIFGASSTTTGREFERFLRDCVSLCAFLGNEDVLVSHIALTGLTTWAFSWRDIMHKVKRPLYYPWFHYKERFFGRTRDSTKLKHYIYEHVHPSLEDACRNLEQSMSKFEFLFRSALKSYGKNVENEHAFLDRIANMATALFAGVACISRASRSYSTGLKHCDFELFLAHDICSRLNNQAKFILDDLSARSPKSHQDFDLYDKKISFQITGEKGYPMSSPISRMW